VRSWAKPLSHVRLHVQLQLHVCLHGAIVATIACLFTRCDRRGDRLVCGGMACGLRLVAFWQHNANAKC